MQAEVVILTREEFKTLEISFLENLWRDGWTMDEDGDMIYFWR